MNISNLLSLKTFTMMLIIFFIIGPISIENLVFDVVNFDTDGYGFIAFAQPATGPKTVAIPWIKPQVIIETDTPGGDPDDEASLVRFFLYINEWDVFF